MSARLHLLATLAAGGLLAGCAGRAPRPTPPGTLAGVLRTADTGAPVTDAVIEVRGAGGQPALEARPDDAGAYELSSLPPGAYDVTIRRDRLILADARVSIEGGRLTGLDLAVRPDAADPDADARADVVGEVTSEGDGPAGSADDRPAVPVVAAGGAPLWRYRPAGADPRIARIEGTVSEEGARTRLGGAVITVADRAGGLVADAVTDDAGRYRVDGLAPGAYVVSAYYTLVGRGQFEIRRSDVAVAAGEVVVVPLELETDD